MFQQLTTIFAVTCTVVQLVACSDISGNVGSSFWQPNYTVSLVSIGSIVCIFILVMACAKWCPKETAEFKVVLLLFAKCFGY